MKINWVGNGFDIYSGYGRMGAYYVRELCALGIEVVPTPIQALTAPDWMRSMLTTFDEDTLTISLTTPPLFPKSVKRQWAFTMYEDTSIPEGWADIINETCERLIVLCEHNADTFKQAGVSVPIHVVHGGTDPVEFPLIVERPKRPYTFICLGDRGVRKGVEQVWRAFFEAFGDTDEDVRLLIKIREGSQSAVQYATFADERIQVWKEDVEHISDVYREGDCFVFPSYGEGWGMPPREAAMMGLPVIATDWSGLSVGIDEWAIPLRDFKLVPSHLKTKNGQWAMVNHLEVADKMRWCYENQDKARLVGRNASRWLREHQTWTHSAQKLKALIKEHG